MTLATCTGHLIVHSTPSQRHNMLLLLISDIPTNVRLLLPDIALEPVHFVNVILRCDWIKDHATQIFIVDFLDQLHAFQDSLLLQAGLLCLAHIHC